MDLSDQNLKKNAEEKWLNKISPKFAEGGNMGIRMLW